MSAPHVGGGGTANAAPEQCVFSERSSRKRPFSPRSALTAHCESRKLAGESGSGKAPLSVRRHHDGGGMRCCSTGFDDEWRASGIAIGCDGVRALYSAQTGILEGLADVRFSNRPFRVKRFQTIHQFTVAAIPPRLWSRRRATSSRAPIRGSPGLRFATAGTAFLTAGKAV